MSRNTALYHITSAQTDRQGGQDMGTHWMEISGVKARGKVLQLVVVSDGRGGLQETEVCRGVEAQHLLLCGCATH